MDFDSSTYAPFMMPGEVEDTDPVCGSCGCGPCACEQQEPTPEDLWTIRTWSWSEYERGYQQYLCEVAGRGEKFLNWTIGLGYKLDTEVA